MPTILCYGDSNTHGTMPMRTLDDVGRFGPGERWAGVMRGILGSGWWVVEEGLPGRTTVLDDPIEGIYKNGVTHLPPCLESHRPVDVVAIILGTNDLKARFGMPPTDIAAGAGILVETVRNVLRPFGEQPKILLVAPPPILEAGCLADMFAGGAAKSQGLARHYAAAAAKLGAGFLDFGSVIKSSAVDGIHFDLPAHQALGAAMAGAVRSL
ncbi:MAG TPA: SGNH/GDSL hydrolase family protein [Dongiaceae bacterium]|jgi:lysophospholipase L1-like esterase|nr:SGNH/GDSL hydrolase family protein [Dongiaceae bacterium]